MKLRISLFLLFIVSCFSVVGCSFVGSERQEESSNGNENQTWIGETLPIPSENFIIDYDPNQTIYFTCQNIDSDMYMNDTQSFQEFSILSLKHIELEDIAISVPIQSDYNVTISEVDPSLFHTTDYLLNKDNSLTTVTNLMEFPYYLYQNYCGTDWNKMMQLYREAENASKRQAEMELSASGDLTSLKSDEEYIQLEEIVTCFYEYQENFMEDYKKLTTEDLPELYVYNVRVSFGYTKNSSENLESVEKTQDSGIQISRPLKGKQITENFHTIEIQIEDKTYTKDIGEIRLHAESFPQEIVSASNQKYIKNLMGTLLGMGSYPWGDGIAYKTVQRFQAKEDIVLTKLYLYESDVVPLGAKVITSTESPFDENGNLLGNHGVVGDFYWDLKTPLTISEGTYVTIDLFFQDTRLAKLEYGGRIYPVLEYEVGTEVCTCRTELVLDRSSKVDLWLRYAIVFDGLDVENYFEEYYRPIYENWRDNISW